MVSTGSRGAPIQPPERPFYLISKPLFLRLLFACLACLFIGIVWQFKIIFLLPLSLFLVLLSCLFLVFYYLDLN